MEADLQKRHMQIMQDAAKNPQPSTAWGIEMKILVALGCATLIALWSYAHFVN